MQVSAISLPPSCVLFRAAYQSLIGRVARYALSSDFGMLPEIAHNLMAINFEQLLKPQAACAHATPRPCQWPKPSAVQWQKPIPGMGHAVDGNWLSALVSRLARRPWAATWSRGKSNGGLRCRVRVFLNRRQRPFCLVKQAVWQCNTGRLAASYGPFSQQAVAQWVGHDGATAVNHSPGPMPACGA